MYEVPSTMMCFSVCNGYSSVNKEMVVYAVNKYSSPRRIYKWF